MVPFETMAAVPAVRALPAELLDRLSAFARSAALGGLAPKTVSALKSDGRLFSNWCAARGDAWLPAAPGTVAAFVEAMAAQKKAPATVARYLASIALWHRAADLPSPTGALPVQMARRAHLRAVGKRQKQAKPIGDTEIADIEAALADAGPDGQGGHPLAALRDRALLLVARDTLCRASELVALRWDDLRIDEQTGEGDILVRRSKTDQDGEGRHKWLDIDTVQALLSWRQAHDDELARRIADEPRRLADLRVRRRPGTAPQGRKRLNPLRLPVPLAWLPTAHLFRGLAPHFVYETIPSASGGEPVRVLRRALGWSETLASASVTRLLKRRMTEAGFVDEEYSAHSTRVGGVQDLLADGVDLFAVMDAGSWKSPAMPARYGERILAARGAVATRRRRKRGEAPDDGDSGQSEG